MPEHFDYLIVGGGMVADNAARGIREHDQNGTIGILSEDVDPPYTRPALTKKLWTDPEFTWDKVPLGTAGDTAADIRTTTHVQRLDRDARSVTTDAGDTFDYGTLLIATGGHPNRIQGLEHDDKVIYFRSAEDYRRLRGFADRSAHVGIVGGSFIATELAAALVQNGCEVTLVFRESTLGSAVFPADLADRYQELFVQHGVHLMPNRSATSGSVSEDAVTLDLDDGSALTVDALVAGLGIVPATKVAADAGIDTGDGILVDDHLRTNDPHVYAAGDVASYPDAILGRIRIEHVDNANEMGHAAGRIMAGDNAPYTHTPYFYSVVFGERYEAVGTLDASAETVEDWADPVKTGVVYYLVNGMLTGVLLWNLPGKRDAARQALAARRAMTADDLTGLIRPE